MGPYFQPAFSPGPLPPVPVPLCLPGLPLDLAGDGDVGGNHVEEAQAMVLAGLWPDKSLPNYH